MVGRFATRAYARLPGKVRSRLRRSPGARRLLRPIDRKARGARYTIDAGPASGITLIPDPAPPTIATGDYELAVQDALVRLLEPGMVFYDIGANVGLFTLLADRLVAPGGSVVAFEPQPLNLVALRRNLSLNLHASEIQIVEAAASERTGRGTFNAETSMTGRIEMGGEIEIELLRIDDFVSDHPGAVPNVVKIDVEGHELEVLAGMAETLARHRPVAIIEAHSTVPQIESWLRERNYRLTPVQEAAGRPRHVLAEPN